MDSLDFYLRNLDANNTKIDCLDPKIIDKIIKLATGRKQYADETISKLISEVAVEYKKAQLRIILQHQLAKYSRYKLPVIKYHIQIPAFNNFKVIKQKLHREILYVHPEIHYALGKIIILCSKASALSLFSCNPEKCLSLQQFKVNQLQKATKTINYLKGQWVEEIVKIIRISFRELGKGAFDIHQTDPTIYQVLKLKRFVNLVVQYMQAALSSLIKSSIEEFLVLLKIKDRENSSSLHAVFSVTLIANSKGIYYEENIKELVVDLLNMIDNFVTELHGIRHPQASLFPLLKFPQEFLSPLGLLDDVIVDAKKVIESSYQLFVDNLKNYASNWKGYCSFLDLDVDSYLRGIEAEDLDSNEIFQGILHHITESNYLDENLPGIVEIDIFKIKIEVKKILVQKYDTIARGFIRIYTEKCRKKIAGIIESYQNIENNLMKISNSIEELIEVKKYIKEVPEIVNKLNIETDIVISEYNLLETIKYNISNEEFNLQYKALGFPLKIMQQIEFNSKELELERLKFLKDLQKEEAEIEEKVEALIAEFQKVKFVIDIDKALEYAVEIKRMWKLVDYCKAQVELIKSRQSLFDLPVKEFNNLRGLINNLKPYKILWEAVEDWLKVEVQCLENPIASIKCDKIMNFIEEIEINILQSAKVFINKPEMLKVTSYIIEKIEIFKPYFRIFDIVNYPGLRDRHIEEINEQTGVYLDKSGSLEKLLDLGIMNYMEIIEEIADKAREEYSVEEILEKISQSWRNVEIEIETESFVVNVSSELLEKLEEDIQHVKGIDCKAFENFIAEWRIKLENVREFLKLWIEFQRTRLNLENLFNNEGISRQLPVEYKKFSTVRRYWKRIIKKAKENSNILELCSDKTLLNILKECISLMKLVNKGLSNNAEALEPYLHKSFKSIQHQD